MTTATHKKIVAQKGPAVGKITGINHCVLVVKDMDESIRFYRDLLGLKVVATRAEFDPRRDVSNNKAPMDAGPSGVRHNYFLQMANGEIITLVEVDRAEKAEQSVFSAGLWPGKSAPPARPRKLDHLALNVESRDDLVWFQKHLRGNGVEVSEIEERAMDPKFVKSLYFYDPNGVPLEIATWDWKDPNWKSHKAEDWLRDEHPVPSLLK